MVHSTICAYLDKESRFNSFLTRNTCVSQSKVLYPNNQFTSTHLAWLKTYGVQSDTWGLNCFTLFHFTLLRLRISFLEPSLDFPSHAGISWGNWPSRGNVAFDSDGSKSVSIRWTCRIGPSLPSLSHNKNYRMSAGTVTMCNLGYWRYRWLSYYSKDYWVYDNVNENTFMNEDNRAQ